MAQKVCIVTVISEEIAGILKEEKVYNEILPLDSNPISFNETIKRFMADNVGLDTGPIAGLIKLNGEDISLNSTAFSGDKRISDIFSIVRGELVLELSVPLDLIICIGMQKLQELQELARTLGEEEELIHRLLYEALQVGSVPADDSEVYCFLPQIKRQDCSKFFRYNSEWKADYSDILGGVEEISVSKMVGF